MKKSVRIAPRDENVEIRRKSLKKFSAHNNESEKLEEYKKFVTSHFHQVECVNFVGEDVCKCGETKKFHKKTEESKEGNAWDEINSMRDKKTNSYGKIEFIGENILTKAQTNYVRLKHDDNMDKVFQLLNKYWKIKCGSLVISVIGGAKNFNMPKREKDIFMNGLVKAVQTTNALIITAGLNLGITKVVGQAVQEGQSFLFDKKKHSNPIVCLGISPWGYVLDRKSLENVRGNTVKYKISNEVLSKQPVSLNSNHTHYIFVDEGIRKKFNGTKAGHFRALLENKMHREEQKSVVLLVVEGGHDVFEEASRSVSENVPVVICEGTGRASDVLGVAYRERLRMKNASSEDPTFHFTEKFKEYLTPMIVPISTKERVESAILDIEKIVVKDYLITMFNMKTSEDLDIAILYSLIKKMKHSKVDDKKQSLYNQISLCLTWNRVDIARDKIFIDEVQLKEENWNILLDQSIRSGKVDFIDLLLSNGAPIKEYLTPEKLKDLYLNCDRRHHFLQTCQVFLKKSVSDLTDINDLLNHMFGHNSVAVYKTSKTQLKHPFKDFLIWAVLMERHECAKFFWEHCEDSIFMAIVITKLYLVQKNSAMIQETERKDELEKWKNYFEDMAIKVIDEFHDIEPTYAAELLNRPKRAFGNITCLELAFKAKDERFISSIVCQNSIDLTWYNGLRISLLWCLIGIFVPYGTLNYRAMWMQNNTKHSSNESTELDKSVSSSNDENNGYNRNNNANRSSNESTEKDKSISSSTDENNGIFSMISKFYVAPQTKFVLHFLINTIFLLYNSWCILYGMRRDNIATPYEITFIMYHLSFILDKFIEIITFSKKSIKYRGRDWLLSSRWSILDIMIIIISFVGICLGISRIWTSGDDKIKVYRSAKCFYSLTVGLFYLRFLRLLTLNPNLGPKMVMISKMLGELFLYLFIVIIILLSYGVTSQASYYTERQFEVSKLADIIAYPYWNLFGELSLDETVYFEKCNKSDASSPTGDCAEYNPFIPMLYAAYIFIGNILLLNVLIAIFSYIFQEIHENSIDVWKFSMYSLVIEYEKKVIVPPPLSLFVYLFLMFYQCHKKCRKSVNNDEFETDPLEIDKPEPPEIEVRSRSNMMNKQNTQLSLNSDKEKLTLLTVNTPEDKEKLIRRLYETNCKSNVLNQFNEHQSKSLDTAILKIMTKLKTVTMAVSNIENKMEKLGNVENSKQPSISIDEQQKLKSYKSMEPAASDQSDQQSKWQDEIHQIVNNLSKQTDYNTKKVTKLSKYFKKSQKLIEDGFESLQTQLTQQRCQVQQQNQEELELHRRSTLHRESESVTKLDDLEKKLDKFKSDTVSALKSIEFVLRDDKK